MGSESDNNLTKSYKGMPDIIALDKEEDINSWKQFGKKSYRHKNYKTDTLRLITVSFQPLKVKQILHRGQVLAWW